ncbi:hypothetical protein HAPAU_37000 [Halalkalicoccus paucihalophilus]|uniref:Uncharacterized protein n=1 Tax=Halalkalicoccus paucihalophilus TaxID=1008153 RepID=A0A151A9D8_9EURY|nr:hypothetical protein HAPAU_37000 [Halalkalicoccus paucihalophilus]
MLVSRALTQQLLLQNRLFQPTPFTMSQSKSTLFERAVRNWSMASEKS